MYSFFGLGWWTTYDWQATATKQSPSTQDGPILTLFGVFLCLLGMAQIVRPQPDYQTHALQAAMSLLVTNGVQVEVQLSFSLFMITWFT